MENIQKELITNFRNQIFSPFLRAIKEYHLINDGDKIACCISGGKDSFLMALCFKEILKYSKIPFSVKYLLMNPGYKEKDLELIKENAKKLDLELEIFDTNIFKVSNMQDKNKCYICAKMRRGALYNEAQKLGCNKIALGHHFNDVIETSMMSILYSGEVSTMLPILKSTNYNDMELIRPLYYVKEEDIIKFWEANDIKFIKYACYLTENQTLCESSKRQVIKNILNNLEKENPYILKNIFTSMSNVNIDKILAYKKDGEEIEVVKKYKDN